MWLTIAEIFLILMIILINIAWFLSNIILKPKILDYESLYNREMGNGRLNEVLYQNWIKEDYRIKSRYGYDLSCQIINNEISKKQWEVPYEKRKIAIICHGYTCAKCSSMIYADLFIKRGITVITYDHRNHGFSGKAYTSLGYYEKDDLQTVIDWCYQKFGENLAIITHGESMGAATVLSHLSIDDRVLCTIADCAYSSVNDLIKIIIKKNFHIPLFPLVHLAKLIIKLRAGFWLGDILPKQGAASKTPILFIHGLEDELIPYDMSKEMFGAKEDKKELYLAPHAKHAESCLKNHEEYEKVMNQFLDKYYFNCIK